MDIFVAPFKVVDDPFVSKLLLDDEDILEEVNDPLFNVEVVELSDHRLLVLQILLIRVNQRISIVYYSSDVVENAGISTPLERGQLILQILILLLLPRQLVVHVSNLSVIPLQLTHYHFLVSTTIHPLVNSETKMVKINLF